MAVRLNHTIVHARNQKATADFITGILGLADPKPFGHFLVIEAANEVSLDVLEVNGPIPPQHYAFLVTEAEFDQIFGRIKDRGLQYWADPMHRRPDEINTNDGGRGVYWDDPNGHRLEIITRPYGG